MKGLAERMRIVCVSSSKIPSDSANSIQVMKVCQAFTQLGHEVILLVPGTQPDNLLPTVLQTYYGLHTLFNIEWLPVRNRHLFPWIAARHAVHLRADLLYAWPIQSAVLGLLMAIPSILELHDYPKGHFGPLWLRLFLTIPGRKRLLPITEALRSALNLSLAQTIIAPDGVDLERYASLPISANARRELCFPPTPTVLCTGHLYEGRGADLFLALASRFPLVSFVWVGGRPEDVETWKTHVTRQNLANVTFTGFVPNERIPLYQSAADVLLMPYQRTVSTSSGGNTAEICSPMKMFEYMATGRPILTSDLPVLHEVLDDSTAVFCPPDNLEAWGSALRNLLADDKLRQDLGQRALAKVNAYTWVERSRRTLAGF
jgi:glycosyltransferase involved in cell wall biosynthesis